MKRSILLGFVALSAVSSTFANIWDTKDQIEKRWGAPIQISGYPDERIYTYRAGSYQVRVAFLDGFSQCEQYRHPGLPGRHPALSGAEVERLLKDNSFGQQWEREENNYWLPDKSVRAYLPADAGGLMGLYFESSQHAAIPFDPNRYLRTGKVSTFSGKVTFRQVEESQWLVLHDGNYVLEIPWRWADDSTPAKVKAGHTYRISLLDEDGLDTFTRTACLSDREHNDWSDAVYDSKSYVLALIQDRFGTLFDRSVCEIHRLKMMRKEAEVSYGMFASDECDRRFPHHRNYILGGCIDQGKKSGTLFVCPLCVAACGVYKFTHPSKDRE